MHCEQCGRAVKINTFSPNLNFTKLSVVKIIAITGQADGQTDGQNVTHHVMEPPMGELHSNACS